MFLRDTRGIVRPKRARSLSLHRLRDQRPKQHACGGQRYVPVLALYKSHRLERREERLGIGLVRIERHALERTEPTTGKPETARPVVFFDETGKGPGGALPNIANSLRLFVIKPYNKAGCTIPHSVKSHMGRTWFP